MARKKTAVTAGLVESSVPVSSSTATFENQLKERIDNLVRYAICERSRVENELEPFTPSDSELISLQSSGRAQWLENRRDGIGSSDAPVISGVKSYGRTVHDIWAEKTRLHTEDPNKEIPDMILFGTLLEPIVAQEFQRRNDGIEVFGGGELLRSKEFPFMQATCDRFCKDETGEVGILEIKTSSSFNYELWTEDEPPPYVAVQTQHQLTVTGLEFAYIACLLGGQKWVQFRVERNNDFIDWLVLKEKAFWDLVISKTPPEIDHTKNAARLISLLYPAKPTEPEPATLPEKSIAWTDRIGELDMKIKDLEAERDLLRNEIRRAIGVCWMGELPDGGGRWSWKPDKNGRRNLRFKRRKQK